MVNEQIHIIPCDAVAVGRGSIRARCGALVRNLPMADRPTCPTCLTLDREDARALAALEAMDGCVRCGGEKAPDADYCAVCRAEVYR